MRLRDAAPAEIDTILSHTHALWCDGLEMPAYREFIATLMASDWARGPGRGYRFLALADEADGVVAGGMKLYRFTARIDGTLATVGGIGAVFTLPAHRRKGLAAEMIRQAHAIMAARGDRLSLLYSEIGAGYYARLGYREVACHAARVRVPASGAPPAGVAAIGRDRLEEMFRIREREDAGARFALVRDRAYWGYLLARASYPTLHLGRDRWEKRLTLVGGGTGEGYLWAHFGGDHLGVGARLLEMGETTPGGTAPALLDDLFEECRRRGVEEIEAWLPPGIAARDPRLSGPLVTRIEPPPVVPMWLPLDGGTEALLAGLEREASLQMTDLF